MTITKLLCKYIDRGGKGYITMGNLITTFIRLWAALAFVLLYIQGAIFTSRGVYLPSDIDTLYEALSIAVFIGTNIPVTVAVAVIILLSLHTCITSAWHTKIVTCEREEKDVKERGGF
jgi:hypothetical protein